MIIHCWYKVCEDANRIALCPTTSLSYAAMRELKSRLHYADGIAIYPEGQVTEYLETVRFTLYFDPLPSDCRMFEFSEESFEPYAFFAFNIKRKMSDEYWVELLSAPF